MVLWAREHDKNFPLLSLRVPWGRFLRLSALDRVQDRCSVLAYGLHYKMAQSCDIVMQMEFAFFPSSDGLQTLQSTGVFPPCFYFEATTSGTQGSYLFLC